MARSHNAFQIVEKNGRFGATGANGVIQGWFSTRKEAEDHIAWAREIYDRLHPDEATGKPNSNLGSTQPDPDLKLPTPPPASGVVAPPPPDSNQRIAGSFRAQVARMGQASSFASGFSSGFSSSFTGGFARSFATNTTNAATVPSTPGINQSIGASVAPTPGGIGQARASQSATSVPPTPSSTSSNPSANFVNSIKSSISSIQSFASAVASSFHSVVTASGGLKSAFVANVKSFASPGPGGVSRSTNTSPFTAASGPSFKASAQAMASAFRAAFQSPNGGIPLGGYGANVAAGFGRTAAGINAGIGSGFRRAARRAKVGTRFARMAASRVKFNPRAPIRSAFGKASASASGFASGIGGRAGAAGFQASSMIVAGVIEAGKMLYDLSRIGFSAVVAMRTFAESALQSSQKFASVNVPIAYSMQKVMFDQLHRDISMGKDIEKTATDLAASANAMRESWKGWDTFAANSENRLASAFAAGSAEAGKFMSTIGNAANAAMNEADPSGTLFPALAASLIATLTQGLNEVMTAIALGPIQGMINAAGAPGRIQAAQNAAANNAAQAIVNQNNWGMDAGRQLHAWVAQGPIRGPRRMPN